jgi:hypothetical protein
MVATAPNEQKSAARVSLRPVQQPEGEAASQDSAQGSPAARTPDVDLADVRDPRREEFLKKEEVRGRQ